MNKFYRPDIDALRGISVLSVVLYHAKIQLFGKVFFIGGFIGVDIFFIITGFLITKLLLIEYEAYKNINIIAFYKRRIRRLIPALVFVLLISLLLSYFVLDPIKLKEFSASLFASLFFTANIYFHYFGDFYGNDVNLRKPLLHLWSLGIEEQFYILYPLVLLFILKYLRKYLLFFLVVGFLISLGFAQYASTHHKMFSFYMLPSRAWEILSGSILAYILIKNQNKFFINKKVGNFFFYLSILVIILSFLFFDIYKIRHPSYLTLLPIISSAIIIFLGSYDDKSLIYKYFSNKILIFLGKISYSLYLWHFLIFAIFRNTYFKETLLIKILIIAVSIALSYFSYKFVEQKYRNIKFDFNKTLKHLTVIIIIITSINLYYILNKKLLNEHYVFDGINITEWKDTNWLRKYVKKNNKKNFNTSLDKKKVLIVGNCHADDTFVALNINKQKFQDYEIILFPRVEIHNFLNDIKKRKKLYDDADIILLSSRWRVKEDFKNFADLIEKIEKDKKKLILLNNIPEFNYNEHNYRIRRVSLTNYKQLVIEKKSTNFSENEILDLKRKYFNQYIQNTEINYINKKLDIFAKSHNIKIIDQSKLLCSDTKKTCNFLIKGIKDEMFRDYGRFSVNGLKVMGEKFNKIGIFND